jgi:urease alpha subunit
MLDVGDPLRVMVGAYGCYSSSCTETVIGECSIEDAGGGEHLVHPQICLRVDSSGVCTDDCGGAGSPECESETPLSAGTHRVRYSNLTVELEVPSALSGARCSGFL